MCSSSAPSGHFTRNGGRRSRSARHHRPFRLPSGDREGFSYLTLTLVTLGVGFVSERGYICTEKSHSRLWREAGIGATRPETESPRGSCPRTPMRSSKEAPERQRPCSSRKGPAPNPREHTSHDIVRNTGEGAWECMPAYIPTLPKRAERRRSMSSFFYCLILEPRVGIEPTTCALPWRCSTN